MLRIFSFNSTWSNNDEWYFCEVTQSRGAFIKRVRKMFGLFDIKKRFRRIRTELTEHFLVHILYGPTVG